MKSSVDSTIERLPPNPCHDWMRQDLPLDFELTPWQQWMRELDWSRSSVGPMSAWPLQLRQMVLLITQDPEPAAVYWGDQHVHIYNEAYTRLLGGKHPSLQGHDPHIILDKVWGEFDTILAESKITGQAHVGDGHMLLYTRNGYLEETYYSWKFIPVLGEDGTVVAFHGSVNEVTRDVLGGRRTSSIRGLRQTMVRAENLKSFWSLLLEGLQSNPKDLPMVMAYSANQLGSKNDSDTFALEGALGVPLHHPAAPATVNLHHRSGGFTAAMRSALSVREPLLLDAKDEIFENGLLEGLEWRGFAVPSSQIVICPIRSMADDIVGFLIIGLNPRNVFDSDYRDFVRRITDSIDPAKVSSILLAEEMGRKETECRLTKSQLRISELEHRQFADHAPLGVCRINADGLLAYANDAWYAITGQEKEDCDPKAWRKTIHEVDLSMMISFFDELMAGKNPGTIESRLKRRWYIASPPQAAPPAWILATGYAELNNGSLKNIVCWVTDISAQKAAAKGLQERMEEALELKRQQENFIDMISHEIRNPLSAMLHCADEIIVSLEDSLKVLNKIASGCPDDVERRMFSVPLSLLGTIQHSARTIVYCIQHQRRVVDDVLTLSKLDFDLLTVSPYAVQPVKLVREALEIFDGQLRTADIDFKIQEDPSLRDLGIDWVVLDPGRVLQVLMNLTTNAIKFTRTEPVRHITVTIAASCQVPAFIGIKYLPALERKRKHRVTDGDRENFYLSLTVADTGRGITEDQIKVLFQRFIQATPKTYSQYGGSGLGLYISRQIVDMLGGAIGVKSGRDGSTFTFYLRTHRGVRPRRKEPSDSLLPASIRVSLDAVLFDTDTALLDDSLKGSPERETTDFTSQRRLEAKISGLKILVVEDNLVNQKVLCQQLRKRGFFVEAANNGLEALNQLKQTTIWMNGGPQKKFDIVLMDLEMPVMGGLECIRNIREAEEEGTVNCHVPVIAVTANARSMHAETALKAGMDGCTTKPYRIDHLVLQIEAACKGR